MTNEINRLIQLHLILGFYKDLHYCKFLCLSESSNHVARTEYYLSFIFKSYGFMPNCLLQQLQTDYSFFQNFAN